MIIFIDLESDILRLEEEAAIAIRLNNEDALTRILEEVRVRLMYICEVCEQQKGVLMN